MVQTAKGLIKRSVAKLAELDVAPGGQAELVDTGDQRYGGGDVAGRNSGHPCQSIKQRATRGELAKRHP